MADISLRTYIEEIDGLIDRKQVDEAVAHCRHILALYPKHLDAYRMLGKALLEKGRHGDAADIFQRVLSVAPDDFIAHVGMSIVREDEANLESALWHMERAFETNPSNGAIQEELRRLYGRRDGVTPPRARLTRGALARMYALGELYHQAQAEIQAALAEDTDRVDLETTLAQVYFNSGQYTEAAQTCSHLIQKLPYSKEANRILGNILQAQGRATEAAPYRQRLEAIDPYEAFREPASNGQGAAKVKSEAIRLPKLDYMPGLADSGTPDWVSSAGLTFEAGVSSGADDASTPDWLTNSLTSSTSEAVSEAEMPDWLREMQPTPSAVASPELADDKPGNTDWLNALRAEVPETESTPAASAEPVNPMPDWLQSATGALSPDTMPDWMKEEASPSPDTPDWMNAPTGALTPAADMPDWMQAAAPTSETAEPATDMPDWMKAAAPISEAAEPVTDVPPWMQATASTSETAEPATDMPDWMKAAAPISEAAEPVTDVPPWMQATASTSETAEPAADMPDWMKAAAPTSEAAEPATDMPDWMKAAAPISEAAEPTADVPPWMQATAPTTEAAEPEKPDWLKQMEAESDAYEASLSASAATPAETAPTKRSIAPDELPDFLQMASPEALENANRPSEFADFADDLPVAEEVPTAEAADLPDWLKAAAPPELESVATATPAMSEAEAAQWLAALQTSAATPASEAPPTESGLTASLLGEAETTLENEPPEWLRPPAEAGAETPVSEATEAQPVSDLPDWIKAASPTPADTVTNWLADKPVPDWMRQPGTEAAAPAPEWLRAPAEAEPPTAALPDWAAESEAQAPLVPEAPRVDMPVPGDLASMDADEALRWLESLAAQQGANPEELITQSTTGEAEAVSFAAPGISETPASATAHQPELDSMSADEALRWLEARAPQPAVTAPPVEPTSAEPAPPTPTNAEPDFDAMSPDDAMRWLETLAAQQGADPNELITRSGVSTPSSEPQAWMETSPAPEPEALTTSAPSLEAQSDMSAMNEDDAMRWLESLAAQQGANPDELFTQPATPAPIADVAPAESAAQPDMSAMNEDDAMRWLESLAAQQGANPDELITPPAERTAEPPTWLATTSTPEPEPILETPPAAAEPDLASMSADDAMRWLETLAAQQGANPEELITQPDERLAEPPAWAAAPPAPEPLATPEPAIEAQPEMSDDDAMRWLESLAAQQGADPAELITQPDERQAEPPAWLATMPTSEPEPEAPPAATTAPDVETQAEMSEDDAMRWLESLAAQQGANPDELITTPEERATEPPTWIAAVNPPAAEATPSAHKATEPVAQQEEATPAPLPAPSRVASPPVAPPAPSGTTKLSRLAEQLAAKRRNKDEDIARRFEEQRAEKEAAMREVQDKMEQKKRIGTGPLSARPGTGSLARPGTGSIARPGTGAIARTGPLPEKAAQSTPPKRAALGVTRIARPKKGRARKSPYAAQPASEVFALAQQRISENDYDTATDALHYLVSSNQLVDETVTELETFLRIKPEAVALWQVLGDAYMKNNRLQKALDAYRQALGQL